MYSFYLQAGEERASVISGKTKGKQARDQLLEYVYLIYQSIYIAVVTGWSYPVQLSIFITHLSVRLYLGTTTLSIAIAGKSFNSNIALTTVKLSRIDKRTLAVEASKLLVVLYHGWSGEFVTQHPNDDVGRHRTDFV